MSARLPPLWWHLRLAINSAQNLARHLEELLQALELERVKRTAAAAAKAAKRKRAS